MFYDKSDEKLVLELAAVGPCSLAETSEKDNWVDSVGHLPNYICHVAKAIKRKKGRTTANAIAMAVSRVKLWATSPTVSAETRAKATKAVAEWEALKAKAKTMRLSLSKMKDQKQFVFLSAIPEYSTTMVSSAWEALEDSRVQKELKGEVRGTVTPKRRWLYELWSTFIIVKCPDSVGPIRFEKVPFTVVDSEVIFGEPIPVERVWEDSSTPSEEEVDTTLTPEEIELIRDLLDFRGA